MKREICVIFLICCLTGSLKGDSPQDDSFKRGSAEYISGNLEEALIYIYKAYKQEPQNEKVKQLLSEIYVELSAKYLTEGNYVDASKYLAEAENLNYSRKKTGNLRKAIEKMKEPAKRPPVETRETSGKEKKPSAAPPQVAARKPQKKSAVGIIREKIVEYQPFVIEKKLPVNAAVFAGISAGVLIIISLIIFYFKRAMKINEVKTKEFLEVKAREDKILKGQVSNLQNSADKLKEDLEREKRRKFEITKNMVDEKKRFADEKTYEKISNKIDEVKKAIKKKPAAPEPIPVESFLSEYTDIPTTSEQLGDMLGFASPDNRSQIFWGLGNKTDIRAVEILESFMGQSSGEEYREILKSLKKIAVRPGSSPPIKLKIEKIFSAQRRKGIII
ncbi:MAG: hypothetical protein ABIJ15_02780 [bacterium]